MDTIEKNDVFKLLLALLAIIGIVTTVRAVHGRK